MKPHGPSFRRPVEQKRRRIEQFKKCIRDLEAFDPQKVPKRFGVPEVVALEAAIDKALSSAFGQGTSAYMRYNRAATLDHSPLVTNASVRSTVGEPGSQEARDAQETQEAQEARTNFSEGKKRSIALLRKAICTLEDEIVRAVVVHPVIEAVQQAKTTRTEEVRTFQPRRWGGIDLKAAWHRVGRWWRGRA